MHRALVLAVAALLAWPVGAASLPREPAAPPADAGLAELAALRALATRPLAVPDVGIPVVPRVPLRAVAAASADSGGPDCGGASDAGDSLGDATPVALPVACEGSMDLNDTLDVYAVEVAAGHRLSVSLSMGSAADFDVCVVFEGMPFVCSDNATGEAEAASLVTPGAGAWLVAVLNVNGATATYDLSVDATLAPPLPGDCGPSDASNDPADARPLAWPTTCFGASRFADDMYDWSKLDPTQDAVAVTLTSAQPAAVCLLPGDNDGLALACDVAFPDSPAVVYAHTPGHEGYKLLVFSPSDSSYQLDLAAPAPSDDCGTGQDAAGTIALPLVLGDPRDCGADLLPGDLADAFVVHVPAGLALGVTATFDPATDVLLCVAPVPGAPFAPASCETVWSGGSGVASAGAPAGDARDLIVWVAATGPTPYALAMDVHAPAAQDDCGTGVDAAQELFTGTPTLLPLDCFGEMVTPDGDVWDFYRVPATQGPMYATLTPNVASDLDMCVMTIDFQGLCSFGWGDGEVEDMELPYIADELVVAVLRSTGTGSYHLHVRQQDDCGTGIDALEAPPAALDDARVACDGLLQPLLGDSEDAFVLPPPALPGVARVHLEPWIPSVDVCVVGDPLGRCTSITYESVYVARTTLEPLELLVRAHGVQKREYKLIVEDATGATTTL